MSVKSSQGRGYSRYAPWAAGGMILVTVVRLHELFPPLLAMKPGVLAMVGGAGLTLMTTHYRHLLDVLKQTTSRWIIFLLAWAALAIPTAIYGVVALQSLQSLILATVLYLTISVVAPTYRNYWILVAFLVGGFTVYAAVAMTTGGYNELGRLEAGYSYDPNDLAAMFSLILPLGLALADATAFRWRKILTWGACALLLIGLIQAGSRGAFLAILVWVPLYVIGYPARRRSIMLAGLLVIFSVALPSLTDDIKEELVSLTEIENDYNLSAEMGRVEVWKRGLEYGLHNPLFGVGLGNFSQAEGARLIRLNRNDKWSASHNAFVQVFAELGFPGLVALFSILGLTVGSAFRLWQLSPNSGSRHFGLKERHPELLAAQISFLTTAMFLSHAYHPIMFVLVGLTSLRIRAAKAFPPACRPRQSRRLPYPRTFGSIRTAL